MRSIDFRSDTVTKPTSDMLRAMAQAEVGDDSRNDDPTVQRLQEFAADLLGKEESIIVSSGTMGNLASLLALCDRGDEVIVGANSHIFKDEGAGASVLGGISLFPVPDNQGISTPENVVNAIRPIGTYWPVTRAIAIENTHNHCGGVAIEINAIESVTTVAKKHQILLFMDGARIFNASIALDVKARSLVKDIDLLQICLTKGLGAPFGSLVLGSEKLIKRVKRWRKVLGGGLRQSGIMAAAGLVALKSMIPRLAEDHENARLLRKGLMNISGIKINNKGIQTNMVYAKLTKIKSFEFVECLAKEGIKCLAIDSKTIRFTTHYGISKCDVKKCIETVKKMTI